jgi:hypothetical protein
LRSKRRCEGLRGRGGDEEEVEEKKASLRGGVRRTFVFAPNKDW